MITAKRIENENSYYNTQINQLMMLKLTGLSSGVHHSIAIVSQWE